MNVYIYIPTRRDGTPSKGPALPQSMRPHQLGKTELDFAPHVTSNFVQMIDSGEGPRDEQMLEGHLPRVIYHQVYQSMKIECVSGHHAR